jgi:hypothetical protein
MVPPFDTPGISPYSEIDIFRLRQAICIDVIALYDLPAEVSQANSSV